MTYNIVGRRKDDVMAKVTVEFYDLPDGSYPAEEFLDGLEIKMQAKMLRTIKMFEENGTDLRKPYSEYLRDGIFERSLLYCRRVWFSVHLQTSSMNNTGYHKVHYIIGISKSQ